MEQTAAKPTYNSNSTINTAVIQLNINFNTNYRLEHRENIRPLSRHYFYYNAQCTPLLRSTGIPQSVLNVCEKKSVEKGFATDMNTCQNPRTRKLLR